MKSKNRRAGSAALCSQVLLVSKGRKRRGALVLEILVGLAIVLMVVLVVASLFPSSYQGSIQAARTSAAVNLGRQVLERQKNALPAASVGNQTVQEELWVNGRRLAAEFHYRVDLDSPPGVDPMLWKVTVQWLHSGKVKEICLLGADRP